MLFFEEKLIFIGFSENIEKIKNIFKNSGFLRFFFYITKYT